MRIAIIISIIFCSHFVFATDIDSDSTQITPYKFSDAEYQNGFPKYKIPESSIFSVARSQDNAPEITYYFSKPKQSKEYPIAIFCSGSETRETISSIIHVHRYFLKEFLDLGAALITLEKWGVNGNQINVDDVMRHYTRTQRLIDHRTVINHLLQNPPKGWNGKLIFVGVSEGGRLVSALTAEYPEMTLATVDWSGSGDWGWREQLWAFIVGMRDEMLNNMPWYIKLRSYLPTWMPYSINLNLPKTRAEYDEAMDKILTDPTSEKELMGMTYMYHADALNWPKIDYKDLKSPYLVVAGDQDTIIESSDEFVRKAKQAGANITYIRVAGMDHYVRKRQDILDKSFEWLKPFIHADASDIGFGVHLLSE